MVYVVFEESEVPDNGAVFTFGKSKFAENLPAVFWIRNDPILQVACGDEHSAVVTASGRVFCFGSNEWGQLGLGHSNPITKPALVKGLKHERITMVACGRSHTLVATDGGLVYGFGANGEGQLGLGQTNDFCLQPTALEKFSSSGIKSLSAGAEHSLALTDKGQIYVWGSNSEGQLGLLEKPHAISPVELKLETRAICVGAGYYHSAVVTDDGKLYTFGESEDGKLGLPESMKKKTNKPQHVLGIPGKVTWVSCGGSHTVALTADGKVFSFGDGSNGQLGLGTQFLSTPVPERAILPKDCKVARVSCGENHTALLTDTGQIYMCGDGRHGKLGTGNIDACANQFLPCLITQFNDYQVQQVSCGGLHTLVLAVKKVPLHPNGHTVITSVELHNTDMTPSARERRRKRLSEQLKCSPSEEIFRNGSNGSFEEGNFLAKEAKDAPLCSSDDEIEEKHNRDADDEVQSLTLPSAHGKRGSILQEAERDVTIRHADSDLDILSSEIIEKLDSEEIPDTREESVEKEDNKEEEKEADGDKSQVEETPKKESKEEAEKSEDNAAETTEKNGREIKVPSFNAVNFRFPKLFSRHRKQDSNQDSSVSNTYKSAESLKEKDDDEQEEEAEGKESTAATGRACFPSSQGLKERLFLTPTVSDKDQNKSGQQEGDKQSKTCNIL